MLISDWVSCLWPETTVEVHIDYNPVLTGTAEEVGRSKYKSHKVEEAYISIDGDRIIISIFAKARNRR